MKRTLLALTCLSALNLAAFAAANEKTKPEKPATNERDRSGETKTSGDQSNSSADLKTTQAIRQALMKDDELSMTAKKIKVITANGQVPTRGRLRIHKKKQKSNSLQNQRVAAPRSTINSTSKDRTNKQPHTNERKSLCLNQYSVLQLHTARPNELSSSSKVKASQPRKFQCLCPIQAAHVTWVTLRRQRRRRAQRLVQLPGAPPAA